MSNFESLRIVFMGTPEFAVASLDALLKENFKIVGVITAPDKPAGRGMKLTESAVKKYAVEKDLHVLQPLRLKDPLFLEELRSLQADIQVVVAFRMLPEVVWNMPPMGSVNLHGSLLPQYRGAAPINWAVINGEKVTGVTTFKLKHEIDTGDILLQESFPIHEHDTAGNVHDKMKDIGAKLLVKTLKGLADGSLKETPQEALKANATNSSGTGDHILKHAPKLTTDHCRINFNKTLEEVYNLVRGLSPLPAAFTELNGKMLKIYKCEKGWPGRESTSDTMRPGEHISDGKTFLRFACANGYIDVKELQLEGKKKMMIEDFLRGYHFK
jgi:methionyl-tRNA formyltransferase